MYSRVIFQLAIALALVAFAGCVSSDDGPAGDIVLELIESGDSGQSGTAALIDKGKQTVVVIEIGGRPVSEVQAALIHEGTCDELSPVTAFRLQSTTSGRSETTVDVSLDTLTSGTYAIALHKSGEAFATHTSCGNIKP